jgi:hypothetical protein
MDASFDHDSPLRELIPGRFTRVSVQTPAGEIEARLSERGYWQLRVRRDLETTWRLACTGDLDCGVVTTQPVAAAPAGAVRRHGCREHGDLDSLPEGWPLSADFPRLAQGEHFAPAPTYAVMAPSSAPSLDGADRPLRETSPPAQGNKT